MPLSTLQKWKKYNFLRNIRFKISKPPGTATCNDNNNISLSVVFILQQDPLHSLRGQVNESDGEFLAGSME